MDLCEMVKMRIRVKTSVFDDAEVQPLIDTCLKDLTRVGITAEQDDPLVIQAVVFYCKANFGFSDDQERYQKAYESLRDSMAMSGEYGGGSDAVS